jgi:septum site-determining protein MinD
MARKIVVTSGKGGVGKTTITANLGARLAALGFRVAIIDADIGLNNLDAVMGVENSVMFDLLDVLEGRCRLKQALIQDKRYPLLYILPSTHFSPNSKIDALKLKQVVDSLEYNFDYILLDCPAGIEYGFHRAVTCANEAIIVVTPHISSIRDADKVVSLLNNYKLTNKYLVINRARGDLILNGEMFSVENVVEAMKVSILGVVPEDDDISTLSSIGGFSGSLTSGRAFTLMAENLHTGSKKVYDCTYRYRGLIGTLRRNLKRKV